MLQLFRGETDLVFRAQCTDAIRAHDSRSVLRSNTLINTKDGVLYSLKTVHHPMW